MMTRELAVFGAVVLIWSSFCYADTETPAATTAKSNVREQVAALPTGSTVVVKTRDKRISKGNLGALSDSGFELLRVNKQAHNETLAFADVKSVKVKPTDLSTRAKVVIAVVAVVGFFLILAAVGVARST
jgi:hypothetical protein